MKTRKINKRFKRPPIKLVFWSTLFVVFSAFTLLFGPEFIRHRLEDKGWNFQKADSTSTIESGQVGDVFGGTVGPMVAWMASILTFAAFYIQYRANQQQKKQFRKQAKDTSIERFENRFFEMLRILRANVEELNFTTKHRVRERTSWQTTTVREEVKDKSEGRKVFKVISEDFTTLYQELAVFFPSDIVFGSIYEDSYLEKLGNNKTLVDRKIDLIQYARIDIIYCIFFLGLGVEDRLALNKLFLNRYKPKFYQKVIAFAALKPKEESLYWNSWRTFMSKENRLDIFFKAVDALGIQETQMFEQEHRRLCTEILNEGVLTALGEPLNFFKYYGGHQFRLGHYFRHLFKMVNYVNESTVLKFDQKKDYVGLLRAQLSTAEQRLIFLNSISTFGRIWELEKIASESKEVQLNEQLVTKYNFIKNIPYDVIITGNILISDYYPDVVLETSYDEKATSKKLQRENEYF